MTHEADEMVVVAKAADPAVRVRFPKPILKMLDAAAAKNGRSRNSELIWRLAESLRQNGTKQS